MCESSIYQTEDAFVARIAASGFVYWYSVPTSYLARGGSLTAHKNRWVADTVKAHGRVVNRSALAQAMNQLVNKMRPLIETYFEKEGTA